MILMRLIGDSRNWTSGINNDVKILSDITAKMILAESLRN